MDNVLIAKHHKFYRSLSDILRPGADELEEGKHLVDASKEAGVKFFVWR